MAVEAPSNELTVLPEVLALLDLAGATVTLDALGCRKDLAQRIRVPVDTCGVRAAGPVPLPTHALEHPEALLEPQVEALQAPVAEDAHGQVCRHGVAQSAPSRSHSRRH